MPKTYILVDSSGSATIVGERDIERVAAERMVAGEAFKVYQAEPMRLQLSLSPAGGEEAVTIAPPARTDGRKKVGRKKKVAKKTTKKVSKKRPGRPAAAKTAGTGRVGRPPVNVGPCTVAGCGRPSKTRGLCSAHYQQHRRMIREGEPGLMGDKGAAAPAPTASKKPGRKKATRGRKAAGKVMNGRKTRGRPPKTPAPVEQTPAAAEKTEQ